MKSLTLTRVVDNMWGTFGVLFCGDDLMVSTLERKWQDNHESESSIPIGNYSCKRVTSAKFGNTFEVENVPNRTAILMHKGNLQSDSHGCILIASGYAPINHQLGISNSGEGYTRFMDYMKDDNEFQLTIKNG